jgi:hypothetical protein
MSLNWQSPIVPSPMVYNPTDTSFENLLYNFLIPLEAPSYAMRVNVTLVPQEKDKSQVDPTIGVGFDLRTGGPAVQNAVLTGLGFATNAINATTAPPPDTYEAIEYSYIQLIRSICAYPTATAITQLNGIMADRYDQLTSNSGYLSFVKNNSTVSVHPTFQFQSESEVFGVFKTLWESVFSTEVTNRLPGLGSSFLTSREIEALGSMQWNAPEDGAHAILGGKLKGAITASDRPEAWYEIRHQSNINQDLVAAARRFYESSVFGLFDTPDSPTTSEALQAYQTLTMHRDKILPYELKFGTDPNSPGSMTLSHQLSVAHAKAPSSNLVESLAKSYAPAETAIIADLASTDPFVSTGAMAAFATPTNIYLTSPGSATADARLSWGDTTSGAAAVQQAEQVNANHLILGNESGDTLIGARGTGRNILIAGAGNETLMAGSGADTLIGGQGRSNTYGAAGNDVLMGGAGFDTFDFVVPVSSTVVETIEAGSNQSATLEVNTSAGVVTLGGSNAAPLKFESSAGIYVWSSDGTSAGFQYTFDPISDVLTISDSAAVSAGGMGSNEIEIKNFSRSTRRLSSASRRS